MSLMPWKKNNKKSKKDFRIMDNPKPEEIPLDELEAISTIISMNPRSTRIRPDRIETLFHMQELSIIADPNQNYMIDFSSVKDERDFITISRVCFVVLGLFPKNTGQITISLRCDAYVNPGDKNEFSGTGGLNEMWGFVGAMSHSISTEDRHMLILNVALSGCTVANATVAKLIMLYEFCHSDIPMLYKTPRLIAFTFDAIDESDRLGEMYQRTKDIFRKIHRKKADMRSLQDALNDGNIAVAGTTERVDLTKDATSPLAVRRSIANSEFDSGGPSTSRMERLRNNWN